jgi:hypothetical protein
MAKQLREDFSFAKVAIKLGCQACLSYAEQEQTGKTLVLPMLRLSHTQREFTHYAMAKQLREDFSFANVAIMRWQSQACLSYAEREQTGKTFMS